ncbi:hypothetical protein F5B17DRAFT_407970 [Nemania serpens]|nr:hypothetical protein F5B17DRAFT_407970 [Nemania serpens]
MWYACTLYTLYFVRPVFLDAITITITTLGPSSLEHDREGYGGLVQPENRAGIPMSVWSDQIPASRVTNARTANFIVPMQKR